MLITLVVVTVAFDLFAFWAAGFAIAGGGAPPLSAIGSWLFVASPFVATGYCIHKWLGGRRGESPRT